jgi:hypothetical protein
MNMAGSGLVSGFALGLPLFWSQAVIAEVHSVQALLAALILYPSILPFLRPGKPVWTACAGCCLASIGQPCHSFAASPGPADTVRIEGFRSCATWLSLPLVP